MVSDRSMAALGRPSGSMGPAHCREATAEGEAWSLWKYLAIREANACGAKGSGGLGVRVAPLGATGPPSTAALGLGRRLKGVRVLLQALGMGCRALPTCLRLLSCLHFKHTSGSTGAAGSAPLPPGRN